jgi:hypothetical protein
MNNYAGHILEIPVPPLQLQQQSMVQGTDGKKQAHAVVPTLRPIIQRLYRISHDQ